MVKEIKFKMEFKEQDSIFLDGKEHLIEDIKGDGLSNHILTIKPIKQTKQEDN